MLGIGDVYEVITETINHGGSLYTKSGTVASYISGVMMTNYIKVLITKGDDGIYQISKQA